MKKRLLALLLTLCMIMPLLSPALSAAEGEAPELVEDAAELVQAAEAVPVNLTESTQGLTVEEVNFYAQVSETLQADDVSNYSTSEGNTLSVYNMDDEGTLHEYVFNTDANSTIMLESYSEIVLPVAESGNAIPEEIPVESPVPETFENADAGLVEDAVVPEDNAAATEVYVEAENDTEANAVPDATPVPAAAEEVINTEEETVAADAALDTEAVSMDMGTAGDVTIPEAAAPLEEAVIPDAPPAVAPVYAEAVSSDKDADIPAEETRLMIYPAAGEAAQISDAVASVFPVVEESAAEIEAVSDYLSVPLAEDDTVHVGKTSRTASADEVEVIDVEGMEFSISAAMSVADLKVAETSVNTYTQAAPVTVTAQQLLNKIRQGDEMAISFAKSLGFGSKTKDLIENLTKIIEEYKSNRVKNPDFIEPVFVIDNVSISVDKEIVPDGQNGYKTTVNVDSTAEVTIVYDERGEAKVTRKVPSKNPTDFIITLDVSGSMVSDGRDTAMFSALKVLLDQILKNPENTVSIIFWANNAALMRIKIDENGILETTFSGAEGYTSEIIFNSVLHNEQGKNSTNNYPPTSLSESLPSSSSALPAGEIIKRIEELYGTGGGTHPHQGLNQAIALLNAVNREENRNLGVLLFTDGEAYFTSEPLTIDKELELAKAYGAKIVNVSIGSETQIDSYRRYLDPTYEQYSPSTNENDRQIAQERVLYYNIPKVSNEELASRVTDMFTAAFDTFTTETVQLKSETITTGILAAVEAQVIETIPAGFDLEVFGA